MVFLAFFIGGLIGFFGGAFVVNVRLMNERADIIHKERIREDK